MDKQGVILLVEDDVYILDSNRRILERSGLTVLTAETLGVAREHLKTVTPDVVVLDIMLPDGNGLNFLPELRESCAAPVLFLTAMDAPEDRMAGLCVGGNDYITKPYNINELRQRVLNFLALQSMNKKPAVNIHFGPFKLDSVAQLAFLNGEDLLLSPKEFALLRLLVANENKTMNAVMIYERIWGQPMNNDDSAVKNSMSRLRKKIRGSGYSITTERGEGYCFKSV
jgi:DNA-binding response OmpR family regulator